jgi:HAD superfamily hydrolase (TIGR01509 family)
VTRGLAALLFDVDGTLAETEEIHRRAFNAAFAQAGLDWTWDRALYRDLLAVAGGRERIAHFIASYRPSMPAGDDKTALVATLHRAKTRHYASIVAAEGIALRPGIARTLRQARADGLRLAIVTTTSAENLPPLLGDRLGWFEIVCTAEQVPAKKPRPDAYLWTLDRLGLGAEDCLAIEDSANGVRAACAAGIGVVVTPSVYSQGEDFAGAIAVVSDFGEWGSDAVDIAQLRRWHDATLSARVPSRSGY